MEELQKNYLVIGGSSGIGAGVCDLLLAAGHRVTATSRAPEKISARSGLSTLRFDATDPEASLEIEEPLNGVVYCPGTILLKPFHRLSREEFNDDMQVNFFGAVHAIQAVLPSLKRAPSGEAAIVLFSSVAAQTGMPFHASIGSAKAAIEGLTRSLAAELAPGIRVNAIAPSLTDTPLAASFLSDENRRTAAAKRHPLERIGDPAELAELAVFLLGSASIFMTGQIVAADGGISSVRKF